MGKYAIYGAGSLGTVLGAYITKNGGEIAISPVRSVFNFVTAVQDEVHRFTIGYSRQKHAKTNFEMLITKAEGIGPKRAAALLKHFKTIKAATISILLLVVSLNPFENSKTFCLLRNNTIPTPP